MKRVSFLFATWLISVNLSGSTVSAEEKVSEASTKVPVSTGKYITGGILGTVVGFGIGHGVQGRYKNKGLIFTIAEAVGLGVVTIGLGQCANNLDVDGKRTWDCTPQAGQILAGYAVAVGFHIWEIVDVWTGATPVEDAPKVEEAPKAAMFLNPDPRAPGLGVAFRF